MMLTMFRIAKCCKDHVPRKSRKDRNNSFVSKLPLLHNTGTGISFWAARDTFLWNRYAFRNPLELHYTLPYQFFLLLKFSYLQPFVALLCPTLLPNFIGKNDACLFIQLDFLPLSEKQKERRSRILEKPQSFFGLSKCFT